MERWCVWWTFHLRFVVDISLWNDTCVLNCHALDHVNFCVTE